MTDGRAITGMTADSHARSDIPAFFFPGISIFPDRIEPVFEIELHQAMFYFVSRYLRDIGISEIFQPPPSAPAHFPSVYDPFGLLYERLASYVFQFVSLTTTGCPLSYPPPISLLPIVSLPSSSLLCVRHRIRRNGIRICIGKSSARRRIRSSRISIFRTRMPLLLAVRSAHSCSSRKVVREAFVQLLAL